MFRIGEFSKMSKTTIKTLRYYDETGLLKPEAVDKFTGYRMYTTTQLVRLHSIQALRQAGFKVEEVKSILSGQDCRAILENRKTELLAERSDCESRLTRLEFILNGGQEDFLMNYTAVVKEVPECIVYSKKMVIPDYSAYFQVIPAIGKQLTDRYPDLECAVPEYNFVIYRDGEYREKDVSIEFCEAVKEMKPDFDDIVFKKMASATVVSVMHKGPYSKLGEAYSFLFKWMEENGYTPLDNPRESYIDGIWNKDSEDDWLTELQVPIAK